MTLCIELYFTMPDNTQSYEQSEIHCHSIHRTQTYIKDPHLWIHRWLLFEKAPISFGCVKIKFDSIRDYNAISNLLVAVITTIDR